MKWSFRIGRFLGIDVYMHVTFLILLAFLGLANLLAGGTLVQVASSVLFFLALFGCVLLHEYGHALMARKYGIPTRDITLLPIGGVARLERMPGKPAQELWVALAGPAVNVIIALMLGAWLTVSGGWEPLSSLSTTSGSFLEKLLAVNVFLVLFNLLPAFPMDGGRVLRALLAMRMEYARATRIAAHTGQGMAILFGFAGLFTNPMLLLIALFVWAGAAQEAAAVELKSSLGGLPVREAMLTDFRVLHPQASLREVTTLLLAGSQKDFPVVDQQAVVGMLGHERLFEALRQHGEHTRVEEVMLRGVRTVAADEPLDQAIALAEPGVNTSLPVLWQGRLVGLLTAENIGELVMIRAALQVDNGSPSSCSSAWALETRPLER